MKNNRFLLIGGDSFLARRVAKILVKKKYEYFYTSRRIRKNISNQSIYLDLDKKSYDSKKFKKVINNIDYMIYFIANVGGVYYNHNQVYDINIGVNQLSFLFSIISQYKNNSQKIKFIYISSACVYSDKIQNNSYKESDGFTNLPHYSNFHYSLSKRLQELYVSSYNHIFDSDFIILRPFNFYGPEDNFFDIHSHVIPSLISKFVDCIKLNKKIEITGDTQSIRNFIFVDDVANLIISISKKPNVKNITVNIGSEEANSIEDILNFLILYFKKNYSQFDKNYIYYKKLKNFSGQSIRKCDTSILRKYFPNYNFVKLEEGLIKTLSYLDV